MRNRFIVLAFASLVIVGGCKKANSIVGVWETQTGAVTQTFTFDEGGSCKLSNGMQSATAKYTLADKTLTMTITGLEGMEKLPAQIQKMAQEQIASAKPQVVTIEWKSADEISLTPSATSTTIQAVTLKRRKKE